MERHSYFIAATDKEFKEGLTWTEKMTARLQIQFSNVVILLS